MFREKRLIHRETPSDYDPETTSEAEASAINPEELAKAREFAEGTANVILAMETGNAEGAAKAFYDTYLGTADKMKRYTDFIMTCALPLPALLRHIPGIKKLVNPQYEIKDKAIDSLFSVINKVKEVARDNKSFQALMDTKKQWDELSDEEKEAVTGIMKACIS